MKRSITIAAAALFLAACASSGGTGGGLSLEEAVELSAAAVAEKLPPGTRVAIVGFEAEHQNLAAYIMDELAGALVDGSLEVADRNNLAYVFKELNFQMSGHVDDESAAGVGKFLGAAYVITGQLVNTGNAYRYRVNAITVETAKHEVSERHNVRNDRAARNLVAALQKTKLVSRTASYGAASPGAPESPAPASAGTFLDRGIMFAMRGDYEMAIEDFTEAVRMNPDLYAAYMLRGRALLASMSKVTNVDENFSSVGFTVNISASAEQQAVYDRALADYSQAIKLEPNSAKTYYERGCVYLNKGDKDRAIADYSQAIRLDPNYASAYNTRGSAYYGKRDKDRAIADCNQALRLDPNYALAYSSRAGAYSWKKDVNRAIADYSKAIKLDPNNGDNYWSRGSMYYDKGDYNRAFADFADMVRIYWNVAFYFNIRGAKYYD
jgi:tetratricopeptide (TPR) repeat protein